MQGPQPELRANASREALNAASPGGANRPSAGVGAGPEHETTGLCDSCGQPTTTRCARCKATFFCSRDCQRKAWRLHKLECGVAQPTAAATSPQPAPPAPVPRA